MVAILLGVGAASAQVPEPVMEALGFPRVAADGAEVAQLQADLTWLGLYGGPIDGRMSEDTERSAATFLQSVGASPRRHLGAETRAELARRAAETRRGLGLRREASDWTGIALVMPRAILPMPALFGDPPLSVAYEGTDAAGLSVTLDRYNFPVPTSAWVDQLASSLAEDAEETRIEGVGAWQDWSYLDMVVDRSRWLFVYQHGRTETRGLVIRFDEAATPYLRPLLVQMLESLQPFDGSGVGLRDLERRLRDGTYPGGDRQPEWYRSMIASGSGSIVSYNGHILTNHHVVAGCRSLTVNGYPALLLGSDLRLDLALVQADRFAGRDPVAFPAEEPGLGEEIFVMGYPLFSLSQSINLTEGIISSTVGLYGNRNHIQVTAPVQPGNSGGPVLTRDGTQIAVVVSKPSAFLSETGNAESIAWAIRASAATEFLERYGVEVRTRRAAQTFADRSVADEARRWRAFTVRVECHGS